MESLSRKEYSFFGISLILSALLVFLWFSPLNFHVFMGDDLNLIKAYHSGEFGSGCFWRDVFTIGNNIGKIRPISTGFLLLSVELCQDSYDCFISINYFIFIINASLISLVAYKITDHWRMSILAPPFVFILSRFSYYSVLQVIGSMENLAMTFMLLIVLSFIYFKRTAKIRWLALTVLMFLFVINTHERFIVLLIPIIVFFLVEKKNMRPREFASILFMLFMAIGVYFWLRQFIFPTSFLTGTGGTSIRDTFQLSQMVSFFGEGILNIIGFNAGPAYLSGVHFLDAGIGGRAVGIFLSGSLAAIFGIFLYQKLYKKLGLDIGLVVVFLLMISGLILTSSITIRQEQRWLYAPFTIFVLLVYYMLSKISNPRVKYTLAIIISFSFVSVDVYYRPFIYNVFFIQGQQTAASVKTMIIDKHGKEELMKKDIYIITGGYNFIKSWYLLDDYFFKLYTRASTVRVYYINSLDEIPIVDLNSPLPLVFNVIDVHVIEIPEEKIKQVITKKILALNSEYDFIKKFSSGQLNDYSYVSSPTGQGVFLMEWNDSEGVVNEAITITSPYNILFPTVVCDRGSILIFRSGIPYSTSDGANLYIDVAIEGIRKRILEISIAPAKEDTVVEWKDWNMPIVECTGKPIDIIFGANSPSGNSFADWIALSDVMLVIKK